MRAAVSLLALVVFGQCLLYSLSTPHFTEQVRRAASWAIRPPEELFSFRDSTATFDPVLRAVVTAVRDRVPTSAPVAFVPLFRDTDLAYFQLAYAVSPAYTFEILDKRASTSADMEHTLRGRAQWLVVLNDPEMLKILLGPENTATSALLYLQEDGFDAVAAF